MVMGDTLYVPLLRKNVPLRVVDHRKLSPYIFDLRRKLAPIRARPPALRIAVIFPCQTTIFPAGKVLPCLQYSLLLFLQIQRI